MSDMLLSILQATDNISSTLVINGYAQLVSAYKTAILSLAGLVITVYGYAIVNGFAELSMAQFGKRVLLISFALAFALHWDLFSTYIYDLFTKAPDQIAVHVLNAIPGSHYSDRDSVYGALQDAFDDGLKFGTSAWDRGGKLDFIPYLWAILIWLITFGISGVALLELVIAKLGLAIYLVLAPLAIPMVLFSATKSAIFDNWTRHLLGFALVPIFVMAAVTLTLLLFNKILGNINGSIGQDVLNIGVLTPYILCGIINIALLTRAAMMATSMAGGISTSIGQAATGWTAGKLKNTLLPAKKSSGNGLNISGENHQITLNYGDKSPPPKPNRAST
jgi:type IV secretory pathway VirB6-like protein